ncbi:MAG: helix-turn-helix transcriptional regulator [Pseudomonadota bacterium]
METTQDYNSQIARWFSDAVTSSGQQQQEIAKLLGIQKSSITRMKKGEQKLTALQMLILSNELGVPLPKIGNANNTMQDTFNETSSSRASEEKALFDLAYTKVIELNNAKPPEERLSKFELLEMTFYTIQSISAKQAE